MVILFFLNIIPGGLAIFQSIFAHSSSLLRNLFKITSKSLLLLFNTDGEIFLFVVSFLFFSVSVFQSTLAKPEFRLETLVGSCTAWSMEFSLMAKCRATRLTPACPMCRETHSRISVHVGQVGVQIVNAC